MVLFDYHIDVQGIYIATKLLWMVLPNVNH